MIKHIFREKSTKLCKRDRSGRLTLNLNGNKTMAGCWRVCTVLQGTPKIKRSLTEKLQDWMHSHLLQYVETQCWNEEASSCSALFRSQEIGLSSRCRKKCTKLWNPKSQSKTCDHNHQSNLWQIINTSICFRILIIISTLCILTWVKQSKGKGKMKEKEKEKRCK